MAKPVKIVYPKVVGVECVEPWLCIDDISKYKDALLLYENALHSVELKLSKLSYKPKIIFCSKLECFSAFGFEKPAAASIASLGIIVAPRGWTQYYIEHEIIHQWQSENFGFLSVLLTPESTTRAISVIS